MLTYEFESFHTSENHALLFHTARYVMAQVFPDEILAAFRNEAIPGWGRTPDRTLDVMLCRAEPWVLELAGALIAALRPKLLNSWFPLPSWPFTASRSRTRPDPR